MAVVGVITALEERFGFTVDDDEIDASAFASVGSLVSFVDGKLKGDILESGGRADVPAGG